MGLQSYRNCRANQMPMIEVKQKQDIHMQIFQLIEHERCEMIMWCLCMQVVYICLRENQVLFNVIGLWF